MRFYTYYRVCWAIVIASLLVAAILAIFLRLWTGLSVLDAVGVSLDTLVGDFPEQAKQLQSLQWMARTVRILGWLIIPSFIGILFGGIEQQIVRREEKSIKQLRKSLKAFAKEIRIPEDQIESFVEDAMEEVEGED